MTTANPAQTNTRWDEITRIWQQDKWLYGLIGLFAGFIFGIAASDYLGQIVTWFAGGFWNEALSIAITVIILDRLNNLRAAEARKLALFRQAKSRSNSAALEALDQIQHDGLWDALLDYYRIKNERIDLSQVQWMGGVQLKSAHLENAYLMSARLENANLELAHLENAVVVEK